MTDKLIRITTESARFDYRASTEAHAFELFAVESGYKTYRDLADVLGMTVEAAKSQVHVSYVTLREALDDIIRPALESDVRTDGAVHKFASAEDWSRWCWNGQVGDDAKAFSNMTSVNLFEVRMVVDEALSARDLADINAPFENGEDTSGESDVRYYIAVPGDDQASGIYGIGLSHEEAVRDAYSHANHPEPSVGQDDEGDWVVHTYHDGAYEAFRNETEARDYAAEKGFVARECTERLYGQVAAHGAPTDSFRWKLVTHGLDDIEDYEV